MIEVLSALSIIVGLILKIVAIAFVVSFGGLLLYWLIKNTPDSACHGNCNQGRNCTCKGE